MDKTHRAVGLPLVARKYGEPGEEPERGCGQAGRSWVRKGGVTLSSERGKGNSDI